MTSAVISLAVLGLFFGGLLAIASKVFHVEVDPREAEILENLPGANCGGCGYPGCAGFAAAVAKGDAPIMGCPVGGAPVAEKIGSIMGVDTGEDVERQVALVMCKGSTEVAQNRFEYKGLSTCAAANAVGGGYKTCTYGCLGLGDCFNVCPFGAITMGDNGLPVIDKEKCTACGKCVAACPRGIIKLVPESKKVHVRCNSHERGGDVRKACQVGCIGCGLCARSCPKGAIEMVNNLAVIDYDKCVNCGICVQKCPMKTIDRIDKKD